MVTGLTIQIEKSSGKILGGIRQIILILRPGGQVSGGLIGVSAMSGGNNFPIPWILTGAPSDFDLNAKESDFVTGKMEAKRCHR